MALQPCRASLPRGRLSLQALTPCLRTYTTDTTARSFQLESQDDTRGAVPRWAETPAGLKAPVQLDHAKNPHNKVWNVNSDPRKLDAMYERLLGPGGHRMLPEEVKWLAVTHKSFDQGRRGFNDRLALLGMFCLVTGG